ncbi:IS3 family transposase [Janibacter alkaliphilus]|uniref:Integrase core domain-containing protein n=1 Tax=Janibacter alkaliphilus TaxID=1069963 RepID=A0A852X6B2_9MICO|nr:hypothetical protein [Janibacter alkaliphilus]
MQENSVQEPRASVERMCELLEVSRSGYYDWAVRQQGGPGPRARRLLNLAVKVCAAHEDSDGVYGAPRITAELRAAGEVVSVKTVAKVMRRNGIAGVSPRAWRPVTTIVHPAPHAIPDLVERRLDREGLNQVWTSDITYLATGQGWLYLCAVRDGCSRRVIGYAFSDSLHTDLVEEALSRAVQFRDTSTGSTEDVVFHADRGCQGGFNWSSQHLVVEVFSGSSSAGSGSGGSSEVEVAGSSEVSAACRGGVLGADRCGAVA